MTKILKYTAHEADLAYCTTYSLRLYTSLSALVDEYRRTPEAEKEEMLRAFTQGVFIPLADISFFMDRESLSEFQTQFGYQFKTPEETSAAYHAIFEKVLLLSRVGRVFVRNPHALKRIYDAQATQELTHEQKAGIIRLFHNRMCSWNYTPQLPIDIEDEDKVADYFRRLTEESDFPTEAFAPRTQTPEGQRACPEQE